MHHSGTAAATLSGSKHAHALRSQIRNSWGAWGDGNSCYVKVQASAGGKCLQWVPGHLPAAAHEAEAGPCLLSRA